MWNHTHGVVFISETGTTSNEILFSISYLIGAASVTGAFVIIGIGLFR